MKRPRAVFCFFLFIIVLAGCEKKEIEERLPKDMPKIILEQLCLTETKTGQKLWTLNADRAGVYDEIIKVDEVTIRFYDED